jgi:hypothetical protein
MPERWTRAIIRFRWAVIADPQVAEADYSDRLRSNFKRQGVLQADASRSR